MAKKISDYGVVGNLHSIALVGRDGSIDWLCCPTISSPSMFAALLDSDHGGSFSITPCGEWDSVLTYLDDSNILVGKFRTRTGIYTLTDFMPILEAADREVEHHEHVLFRLIHVQRGTVRLRVLFEPRFRYGKIVPDLALHPGRGIVATGGGESLALATTRDLELREHRAESEWELHEGDRVALHLRYGVASPEPIREKDVEQSLRNTMHYWRNWLYQSGPGLFNDLGPHRMPVVRSLLVLKLLYYEPRGTMAAAATTSLPESIGGVRNWDYRYSWVRDTSMALTALFHVGHVDETEGYLTWLKEIILRNRQRELQVMYRLDGSRNLEEFDLPHLQGFRGSRPVRIGNKAALQKQFSIYGHVLIAAHLLAERKHEIDSEMWHGLRLMCSFVMKHWREPDSSIWEMRKEPQHYVHSKVMCWVTLHNGIEIARMTGMEGDVVEWERACEEIRQEVSTRGWNEARQAFVLHYDTDALDGSSLLISISGFLPYDHPRMLATVEALRADLANEGFIYRYLTDDGLPGKEGTFLACTLWLIINLARQGEIREAELLLTRVDEMAGPLHLFAEEYDPEWEEQLGNFPQAFSHEAYIMAAMTIADAKGAQRQHPPPPDDLLLPGEATRHSPSRAPFRPEQLSGLLVDLEQSPLRGEEPSGTGSAPTVERMNVLLQELSFFDPGNLETSEERISFWVNLFNLLMLHSVHTLDIRSSIKDIPRFFKRVGCRLADCQVTLEIILHGILRGNRPGLGHLVPPLLSGDPRLTWSLRPSDPRILCTVWTGCVSSPPIRILRPKTVWHDLQSATQAFVAGTTRIDMERRELLLPRIFGWYDDFGKTDPDVAVFVARFAETSQARQILEHPESFTVSYRSFDWRLDHKGGTG